MLPTRQRAAAASQLLLIVLGIAWAVFERPAPVIRVRWTDSLPADSRQRDEALLGLHNPEPSDDTWQYELWSPRRADIAAIVAHPDVADTAHVDRAGARILDDAGRGRERVWWAGPFRGPRGRAQFRVLFAIAALAALVLAKYTN
jgi:hypothetical protein